MKRDKGEKLKEVRQLPQSKNEEKEGSRKGSVLIEGQCKEERKRKGGREERKEEMKESKK